MTSNDFTEYAKRIAAIRDELDTLCGDMPAEITDWLDKHYDLPPADLIPILDNINGDMLTHAEETENKPEPENPTVTKTDKAKTDMFRQTILDGLARTDWGHDAIETGILLIAGNTDADDGYGWRPLDRAELERLSTATPEQVTGAEDTPDVHLFDEWENDISSSMYTIDDMTIILRGWSVFDVLRTTLGIGLTYVAD